MRTTKAARQSIILVALLVCAAVVGCSPTDLVEELIPMASVDGTWNYQVDNGDQATFVNCTGDATVLEGKTWNEALALAPICHVDVSFTMTQNLAALVVVPHNVTCSDGSSAVASGVGLVNQFSLSGQWDTASDQNVNGTQGFQGTVNGNTVTLTESNRDFNGGFQGSCDISPPLSSTGTVQ